MQTTTPELVGFSTKRLQRIHHVMQGYVDQGQLAGLITRVARQGKTVHLEKFGMMDIEAGKQMEFDTIFRIASMTKPITSVAIMQLYEQGYFTLNTPVYEFIPGFKDVKVFVKETDSGGVYEELNQPVTMRHLFTHTAGLSYGWNAADPVDRQYQEAQKAVTNPDAWTLKDMVERLPDLPLAFQPGTHWRYSVAIDVLGYIVELISGQSFNVYLRENLFAPLGMIDTDFWVPPEKSDRLAAIYGHPEGAEDLTLIESPKGAKVLRVPVYYAPGGGLVSTIHDYGQFAQMLVNRGALDGERILSPTTVRLYSVNFAPEEALPYDFSSTDYYHMGYGYSLGTRVLMDVGTSGQAGSVGEFGWGGAFNTYVFVDPVEAMYGLLMTQHHPNNYYPIANRFKQLIYQSMVE